MGRLGLLERRVRRTHWRLRTDALDSWERPSGGTYWRCALDAWTPGSAPSRRHLIGGCALTDLNSWERRRPGGIIGGCALGETHDS